MSSSRDSILSSIKQALVKTTNQPFPLRAAQDKNFVTSTEDMAVEFAQNFSGLMGKFCFCINEEEFVARINELLQANKYTTLTCKDEHLKKLLVKYGCAISQFDSPVETSSAAITSCEALVARTGSMVLSSGLPHGRTISVYTPVHICVAYTDQLVFDVADALQLMQKKYEGNLPSSISFATGPSRTADIEKTLVVGVHGPSIAYCFLIQK